MRHIRSAHAVSGGGTTSTKIIQQTKPGGRLEGITVALVIASTENIGAIEKAIKEGIAPEDIVVVDPETFGPAGDERDELFAEAILHECRKREVNFFGQYGWMPRTPKRVIDHFKGNARNQHPGIVRPGQPDFGGRGMYGRRVHCATLDFFRRVKRDNAWTEATCQWVHPELDLGAVVRATRVPILADDDPATLQARMLEVEHETQILSLEDIMHDRVHALADLERVVFPGEEEMLKEAKATARRLYPKG